MYFQVVLMVHFLKQFLIDNPLCIVNDEVGKVKKELLSDEDKCKLMQSSSQILLKIKEEEYYMGFKITVPPDYPAKQIQYVHCTGTAEYFILLIFKYKNVVHGCLIFLSCHFISTLNSLFKRYMYIQVLPFIVSKYSQQSYLSFVIDKEQKRVVNESSPFKIPINLTSLFYNAQSTIQKS